MAELGTMQVSEQTDSLRVLGSDPVDYLVTPRVCACMIAGPILNVLCFTMGALTASSVLPVLRHSNETSSSLGWLNWTPGWARQATSGSSVTYFGSNCATPLRTSGQRMLFCRQVWRRAYCWRSWCTTCRRT